MIAQRIEHVCQKLEDHLKQPTPPLSLCFSKRANQSRSPHEMHKLIYSSVVSQYCFGDENHLLGDIVQALSLRDHLFSLLLGVKFNQHFLG